jgi:hypothetical protein
MVAQSPGRGPQLARWLGAQNAGLKLVTRGFQMLA